MSVRIVQSPIAIFFDMDGTLLDSYGHLMMAHNHVREAFGQESFTEDEFLFNLSRTTTDVYRELYGARAEEAKQILYEYINEHREKRIVPMRGANEILVFLHGQGIVLGVVSNMNPGLLRDQIESLGWTKYFGAVVGAGDATEPKPSATPLILAAERAGVEFDPQKIWMVGDTETDIGCARAAKCVAVLLKSRRDWQNIVRNIPPDLAIETLLEIKGFISIPSFVPAASDEILAPG